MGFLTGKNKEAGINNPCLVTFLNRSFGSQGDSGLGFSVQVVHGLESVSSSCPGETACMLMMISILAILVRE